MPADPSVNSLERDLGVAPSNMMDEQPLLPRRHLAIGAHGEGADGRRYRLLAPIDRGGMGELFLAQMTAPGREPTHVVLKRLLADLLDDDKYVAMFSSEAAVMSKLDHDNIVRVFDTPSIDGSPCLAMEYVRGRNVQQILTRHEELETKMPPGVVLRIMADVLQGLAYAHEFSLADGTPLELVHRDVTPGNVLVSFDGAVKLTDFGIAKSQMSAVSTTVGIVKGKARYLSPEQILGEPATPRSDIFSAASVICEMLTGVPTFDRSSVPKTLYAIVNGNRADLEEVLDFRAPLLVQTLDRALATDPKERIANAREFREGIEASLHLIRGARVEHADVGEYLSQLFAGDEDPLADFHAAPDEGAEAATVGGYRPSPPAPVGHDEKSSERFFETELITRAVPDQRPVSDVLVRARTEGIGQVRTEPRRDGSTPNRRGGSRPPPLPTSDDLGDASATDTSTPNEPSPADLALAAASAHTAGPTQIVRGRPVEPSSSAKPPEDPNASVDEALSVLAWLQSRPVEVPKGEALVAAPRNPTISRPDEPLPQLTNRRGQTIFTFVAGLALGVVLTVIGQGLFGRAAVEAPPPAEQAAVAPPTEAPPASEPSLEAPAAEVLEAAPEAPPPEPIEEAPEAAPIPATLDVVYPRGARVRVDGRLLKKRVPVHGMELSPGEHTIRIFKRGYRKVFTFSPEDGAHYEMSRKLRKQ